MKAQSPSKLLILVVLVLVAGSVAYALVRPPETSGTSWVGRTTEVPVNISEEKKAEYTSQIADLTAEIAAKEAAGQYALDVYFVRGGYYQKLGKLELAFNDFTTVTNGDPSNETAWNNMGDILIDAGDVQGAEIYFQKALQAYKDDTTYNKLYRYYVTYRQDDRFEAIGPLVQNALQDLGPSASWYVKLGRWYVAKGDKDKAVAAYGQAAVLDPNNPEIKTELNAAQAL